MAKSFKYQIQQNCFFMANANDKGTSVLSKLTINSNSLN